MNRSLVIVMGALALGAAVFAGSFFTGQRACVAGMTRPADDLSWLRTEFHLGDAEMARIRQLHEGYLPQCAKMCALLAAKKSEVQTTLSDGTNITVAARTHSKNWSNSANFAPNARRRCCNISSPSARSCPRSRAAVTSPKCSASPSVSTMKSNNP